MWLTAEGLSNLTSHPDPTFNSLNPQLPNLSSKHSSIFAAPEMRGDLFFS